ncbi:peptigoglycan-binding protein LysM [Streptomyces sp. 13-12-16]|uniref:LysM peptidoglycan-binding domain-containing protein n=1 Tax=Streptomyces sp. 13-12-16 TaxID=1570823 RepID=UPI000A1FB409|nr:transglycosylase family protein [Streptomyces sp. 13-12-16]OSP40645.1 peptigoglycan-binding protein LysM [Streptomyces sp. 13-12-16]
MLSGNGRHRRPRQAPALLVAAGVTGSAIAIPLLGAGSASAADGATWDRVAECESGGSWSQNTGNGYYGGLQLTQDDWENYGGLDYATSPDQASRGQQIAVAERILADQGVGAWRTCGLTAGLSQDSASSGIDTGVAGDSASGTSGSSGSSTSSDSTDSSDSSGSSDSGDSSASSSPSATSGAEGSENGEGVAGESAKSDKSSDSDTDSDTGSGDGSGTSPSTSATPKSDESDKSGQTTGSSEVTDTEDTGTGRHRGATAEEGEAEDRTSESSGRHASRGTDASRDAADGSYTVRTGDSLSSIADSLELNGGWRSLYTENEQVVGADPDLILPGQKLEVGVEPGEK